VLEMQLRRASHLWVVILAACELRRSAWQTGLAIGACVFCRAAQQHRMSNSTFAANNAADLHSQGLLSAPIGVTRFVLQWRRLSSGVQEVKRSPKRQ
jgi:hypothetical protein